MISSKNPNEEIVNVHAREIPNANPPKDREADLLSRVPRSSSAWAGMLTLIDRIGRRRRERAGNPFHLSQGELFPTVRSPGENPAQAELERGTLESWDDRRNPFATSC